MSAVVVLPTYDEAENLEPMVAAILEQPGELRVLVVDDASPDGTGDLADRLAAEHPGRVAVLHRPAKEGLGRAYAAGFARALKDGATIILQMDCDFSHDPDDLARLRAPLDAGTADLALGTRWIAGGGTAGWGLGRRLLSRWGSFYSRLWLGLPQRDLTGGFKAWRASTLRAARATDADSRGYAYQVETTLRAVRCGARVVEVPIVFTERRAGRSKMGAGIALEAAWRVPGLRWSVPRDPSTDGGAA